MKKFNDMSYNKIAMEKTLRKGDFRTIPHSDHETFRETITSAAENSAYTVFNGINPIIKFHLKKKSAFKISDLSKDLVIRKLAYNLKKIARPPTENRNNLVLNLRCFLEESVPYRVYRLDIKGFYESFLHEDILNTLFQLDKVSPLDKRLIEALFHNFHIVGGVGLPRGMAISAPISNICMKLFDSAIFSQPFVYFYGRYVDDIVVVTSAAEDRSVFSKFIENNLPPGLTLNTKKTDTINVDEAHRPGKHLTTSSDNKIEYLGYQFIIPSEKVANSNDSFRSITTEISKNKINKIKTRVIKSMINFSKTGNYHLLLERIKYLTSNFSVVDLNTGRRQLAGIFYSYPNLSKNAKSLIDLDEFMKYVINSRNGRLLSSIPRFTSSQKKQLLSYDFKTGHEKRRFIYFSATRISNIQECWKYA